MTWYVPRYGVFRGKYVRWGKNSFLPLIIYYKTPFVKKRLLKPFSHNDDFFGAIFPQKAEKAVFCPENGKKEGVTPM